MVVDFDGSLAPIVDDPAAARPLPAARDALARLVPLVDRAAVVSGRPVEFLLQALRVDGLIYAGLYGLERIVDGEVVVDPRVEPWLAAVAGAADAAEVALPGLLVERKGGVSVTLHWRTAPEREHEVRACARELGDRGGLLLSESRASVELRPPLAVDKGTVVTELVRGESVAAYAGDDTADIPAFDALTRLGASGDLAHVVRIGVTSAEAPPAVLDLDLTVAGPSGLAELLDALALAISDGSRG